MQVYTNPQGEVVVGGNEEVPGQKYMRYHYGYDTISTQTQSTSLKSVATKLN